MRRKHEDAVRRKYQINVAVNDEERARIRALGEKLGLDPVDVIRYTIKQAHDVLLVAKQAEKAQVIVK